VRPGKGETVSASERHRHHAAIELAEKVIDDEDRLLNVIAHEFCHLANFMISGVTTQPHGKEFKSWASKCSRAFAHRNITVTTKHSYDIDFRYIWNCVECGTEFKRHSKSIDTERHRCGSCEGRLEQIKPRPRPRGAPSEYQKFVQVEMKIVKQANPGSPQKDVMRLVADKWKKINKATGEPLARSTSGIEGIAERLGGLVLDTEE
jgi:predicted SprT family Zn-dependent metalloprotease